MIEQESVAFGVFFVAKSLVFFPKLVKRDSAIAEWRKQCDYHLNDSSDFKYPQDYLTH